MTQLALLHEKMTAKYAGTALALAGYLKSVSREKGSVTSDDACEWLLANNFGGDLRLVGAVLREPGFRQIGYAKSRRRRGMHAVWKWSGIEK